MAFIGKHKLGTMKELVVSLYLSQFRVQTLFFWVPNGISKVFCLQTQTLLVMQKFKQKVGQAQGSIEKHVQYRLG